MVLPAVDVERLINGRRASGNALLSVGKLTTELLSYFRSTLPILLSLMTHPGFRFDKFVKRHPGSPFLALPRTLVAFLTAMSQEGRIGVSNWPCSGRSYAVFGEALGHGPTRRRSP
jgi:hypothetical protein